MNLTGLHVTVLTACSDDEVGLWEVIRIVTREIVRQHVGAACYSPPDDIWTKERSEQIQAVEAGIDPVKLQDRTLKVLADLLEAGLIVAGVPDSNGCWNGWDLIASDSIARIRREWDALGGLPMPGDVAWFVSTTHGDRVLHEGKERNAL